MTTTGSLFFSFQLPGLCGSGAYVFSSDNRNSRRGLEEVASAWITEIYRGRANRGKQLPSEKWKVVCRKVYPCHKRRPSILCIFLQCLQCDHSCEWTSLWKLLADCTSTMTNYWSADVFIPITYGPVWMFKQLIVQYYGNVISIQFTASYYRCYTVLSVPAILRHLCCRQFGNIHFDSLSCWLVYRAVTVLNRLSIAMTLVHDISTVILPPNLLTFYHGYLIFKSLPIIKHSPLMVLSL